MSSLHKTLNDFHNVFSLAHPSVNL